jgi:hypothetical protein
MQQRIRLPNLKSCVIIFFLGALLAPIGDICHVLTSTTSYPANYRHFVSIPFWVPLQFGLATLLIGITHHHSLNQRLKTAPIDQIVASSVALLLGYGLSGLLPLQPWLTTFFLLIIFISSYYFLCNNRASLIAAIATAIAGCLVEIALIKTKIFKYEDSYQQLHSIPLWLPLLYMQASITVSSFTHYLNLV